MTLQAIGLLSPGDMDHVVGQLFLKKGDTCIYLPKG